MTQIRQLLKAVTPRQMPFRFFMLIVIFWFSIGNLQLTAEKPPVLSGFLSEPGQSGLLVINGRRILTTPDTQYTCRTPKAMQQNIEVSQQLPIGAKIEVRGIWDKKVSAYRAAAICIVNSHPEAVSGAARIDAVSLTKQGLELIADGRRLRMSGQPAELSKVLRITLPLNTTTAPQPGQWLNYKAIWQIDGFYLLQSAQVSTDIEEDGHLEAKLHAWQPFAFHPPKDGHDGSLQVAYLSPNWKLPGNPELAARLAKVGTSVEPAWQRALPEGDARKWDFRFYALAKAHNLRDYQSLPNPRDCQSLPNGIVVVPEETVATLTRDDQLAAVLAGCIAQVEEEQARNATGKEVAGGLEAASFIALYPAGLLAASIYNNHLREAFEQQTARVSMSYLAMAGYPCTSGPSAWEILESTHGKLDLSHKPGGRSTLLYQVLSENPMPQ